MSLSAYLRDYMADHDIDTIAAFARKLSLYDKEVARVIKEDRRPSRKVYDRLSEALQIPVSELKRIYEGDAANSLPENKIHIASFPDLNRDNDPAGLSSDDIIGMIMNNDRTNYPDIYAKDYLYKAVIGQPDIWKQYMQDYPDYCSYLVDSTGRQPKIVGDWQIAPLEEAQYNAILSGDMVEGDLSEETSPMMTFPGKYHVFLLNFSVNPSYFTVDNIRMLMNSFTEKIRDYQKNGIYFEDIIARPCSRKYQEFFRAMGFEETGAGIGAENEFPLYRLQDVKKLLALYERAEDKE